MSGLSKLERLLHTDAEDVGCDETFALLHVYVERERSSGDAASRYPGVAAHLVVCDPCREDYRGLLELLR